MRRAISSVDARACRRGGEPGGSSTASSMRPVSSAAGSPTAAGRTSRSRRRRCTRPSGTVLKRWCTDQRDERAYRLRAGGPSCSSCAVLAHEVGGEHRRDQARDEQREEHRNRDREAELLEVLAGDAAHEADRREDRDDRHGDGDDGEADLVGGLERRAVGAICPCACGARCSRSRRSRRRPECRSTIVMASRLTRLSEKPSASIAQNVGKIDSGSAIAAMSVARQSRRKTMTTRIARMAPSISVVHGRVVGADGVLRRWCRSG